MDQKERKAWAKFAACAVDDMDAMHMLCDDESSKDYDRKNAAYWQAKRDLEVLGVDVDGMMRQARSER